eukprot:1235981-Amorphochlora_amoeboformis.AAC.1
MVYRSCGLEYSVKQWSSRRYSRGARGLRSYFFRAQVKYPHVSRRNKICLRFILFEGGSAVGVESFSKRYLGRGEK